MGARAGQGPADHAMGAAHQEDSRGGKIRRGGFATVGAGELHRRHASGRDFPVHRRAGGDSAGHYPAGGAVVKAKFNGEPTDAVIE